MKKGPVALTGGAATGPAITTLAVGTRVIEAVYSGATNFAAGSGTLSGGQVVTPAATTTAVTSSANPSVFGQSVTFTANVSSAGGTPTGTVQFQVDGANFGAAVALTAGSATSTATTTLSVATHTVTATYSGAASFQPSNGTLTNGHVVNAASTTTTVGSLTNPSVFGQSVTFTATVGPVAPGAGTPTGNVRFRVDGGNLNPPVALVNGVATSAAVTGLSVGNHIVEADYLGAASFTTSSGTLTGGQVVNPAPTTTAVASSVTPSVFGQSVSFTATVSSSAGTPTGTVQFQVDGADFDTPVALTGGSATSVATSALTVGTHAVTAAYSGATSFQASNGTLTNGQVVNAASTTTSVASSVNPSVFGESVTFTATVAPIAPGTGVPAGTVQFQADGVNLGTAVALSAGQAQSSTSALAVGTRVITATYTPTGTSFTTSSGTLTGGQVVNAASTTTTVTSSVNPSVFGQSVTFTATVAPVAPGAGTPAGTVQFQVDGVDFGAAIALTGGSATTPTTTALTVGTHTVTASYSGVTDFLTSSGTLTGGQVVNVAATATTIDSLIPEPSTVAVPVRVYFTVAATAPGSGTPTGQVTVTSDEPLAQCAAAVGQGYCDITFAVIGTKTLTAAYGGDDNFQTSTSASVPHTVNLVVGSASEPGAPEANGMMFANLELGTGPVPQSARGRPTAAAPTEGVTRITSAAFEAPLFIQRTLGPVRL